MKKFHSLKQKVTESEKILIKALESIVSGSNDPFGTALGGRVGIPSISMEG